MLRQYWMPLGSTRGSRERHTTGYLPINKSSATTAKSPPKTRLKHRSVFQGRLSGTGRLVRSCHHRRQEGVYPRATAAKPAAFEHAAGAIPGLCSKTKVRICQRARRTGQAQGVHRTLRESVPEKSNRGSRTVLARPITRFTNPEPANGLDARFSMSGSRDLPGCARQPNEKAPQNLKISELRSLVGARSDRFGLLSRACPIDSDSIDSD